MSDLIDSPGQGENAPEFSVSELSSVLKRMIEGEFSNVRIRGEVGRVSRPASGHLLSLIHISEPTRLRRISYAVFCLKKKKNKQQKKTAKKE